MINYRFIASTSLLKSLSNQFIRNWMTTTVKNIYCFWSLQCLFGNITGLVDKDEAILVTYFDLSKLAGTSPHDICNIRKIRLDTMAISQVPNSVCTLEVDDSNSSLMSWEDISDRYLQGSGLGQVLIDIFFNRLKEKIKNMFVTFAENVSLRVASSKNKMRIQNASDSHKIKINKKQQVLC